MEEPQIRPLQAVFSAFLAMLVSYIGIVAVPVTVLMDCSIVTAGSLVTFDGKRYYALDAYTLMEVG